MTPQEFVNKWGPGGSAHALNERQGAQAHFMDLCQLLGVPTPGSDGDYVFEQGTLVLGERRGYADVFKRGHFAWENKAPGRNLDEALKQLLTYSLALDNPPLLVVCDRNTIRIHTRFTGHPSEVHTVLLHEMDQPDKQALLRRLWTDPESFRPKLTSRAITEEAAHRFATLAEGLRKRGPGSHEHADQVAHFLTQCLFCFFAEDVGLLPGHMFKALLNNRRLTAERLGLGLTNLFTTMRDGGVYGSDDIPWFNGGLFRSIQIPELTLMEVTELRRAALLNWSAIDVSIFGTLFERGLDPAKRSQLGAHYTDPATILRIVDPVLTRPLLQTWASVAQQIGGHMARCKHKRRAAYSAGGRRYPAHEGDAAFQAAERVFFQWLEQLRTYRVLDPACGSGNFLFLGLKALKDIEHKSHLEAANLGLDRQADLVTGPHNVLGIEINEYAAELARVTVWIGELQWRLAHGYAFKVNPVLEPLDHIECRDALLGTDAAQGNPVEAAWPWASVVIGNPPFLGGSKKRRELGDAYFQALQTVYANRVPAGADLVCYWFEKARHAIATNGLGAAGLVATQAIRAGSNRVVLAAICNTSKIFDAWSDEAWINEGAAVRVSQVCFGHAVQIPQLDGREVHGITADLNDGSHGDLTSARPLASNAAASFEGTKKYGAFDVAGPLAREWLRLPNPHGLSNALVVKPWRNGQDLSGRPADKWIIDFGTHMPERDAALFEAPFDHVVRHVKPNRMQMAGEAATQLWWLHERARVALRQALQGLNRYLVTPRVAKHRFFVFLDASVLPDTRLNVVARSDDTTFGIVHSRMHETWSLAQASIHGDGVDGGRPTYNAKSCFETFPFPLGLTPADTAHQRTEMVEGGALIPAGLSTQKAAAMGIAQAAQRLHALRENWLNPPEWVDQVPEVVPLGYTVSPYPTRIMVKPGHAKDLAQRTLTHLYNQRPAWLQTAHSELDRAVAQAYGWTDYSAAMPDADILQRLLALNRARAAAQA